MPRVVVSGRAERDLHDLSEGIRGAVAAAISRLAADPEAAGKKLRGRLAGLWVCRIGSYRLLYRIEGGGASSQRVIVLAIRHRSVAYPRRPRRR